MLNDGKLIITSRVPKTKIYRHMFRKIGFVIFGGGSMIGHFNTFVITIPQLLKDSDYVLKQPKSFIHT